MEKTPLRQPKVSIIILTWNSYDVTRDCLLSLRKIDYPAFEVVLVDNGSVDGSGKKLAQDFPDVRVILNDKNLGFTGGNNVGMRDVLARGTDYLLLLNNDTIVAPNFLTELVKIAESDERIGMVNPKIYYFEPADKIWYAGGEYVPWKTFPVHFGLRESDVGSYDQTKEVSFVSGCALLVRAEAVRKVGLLDEIFFMGYEDVDWSVRTLRAGYKAMYVPASVVWHRDSYVTKQSMGFRQAGFLQHEKRSLVRAQVSASPPAAFVRILHEQIRGLCHAQVSLSGGFQARRRSLSRVVERLLDRHSKATPPVIMLWSIREV